MGEVHNVNFIGEGLALDMALKFYTRVAKGLKLKARKLWGLISTFVEVIGEKLADGTFCRLFLNRVKVNLASQAELTPYLSLNITTNTILKCILPKAKLTTHHSLDTCTNTF